VQLYPTWGLKIGACGNYLTSSLENTMLLAIPFHIHVLAMNDFWLYQILCIFIKNIAAALTKGYTFVLGDSIVKKHKLQYNIVSIEPIKELYELEKDDVVK
jgi:hypothetical protein